MAVSLSPQEQYQAYLQQLRQPFVKLCRLRFLQPDGTTAFVLDNNPLNPRSNAFIQEGEISCNLNNGVRRTATVTLSNKDGAFDLGYNKIWFGQEVALDEGLVLPNGEEYYMPQGRFYIQDPSEIVAPNQRTVTYNLVDKWAYLDGTLFGNLEGIYQVLYGTNIFEAMSALLKLDRGNGIALDNVSPIFTEWYNGKTQELPDGTMSNLVDTPYKLIVDSENGSYADVLLGLSEMLAAWVGYDATGALRIDPSQDDILDINKPILWEFSLEDTQLLGMTYNVLNTQVYNDYIITGELLSDNSQPAARAVNKDPNSDTNIYTSLGRRVKRESAAGYSTTRQCVDLAVWKLKRATILQKSVTITCPQMFHITENNLVTIARTDKEGSPVERHLITGFSRPLAQAQPMTIQCTSVNDFPIATTEEWPPKTT